MFQLQPLQEEEKKHNQKKKQNTYSTTLLFGLGERGEEEGREGGRNVSFLIPGLCRVLGESSQRCRD